MRAFSALIAVMLMVSAGTADAVYRGDIYRGRLEPSDFLSAAPTQRAPPDGGRRYEYPPDTRKIIRPENRTDYDVPPIEPLAKASRPVPSPSSRPASPRPGRVDPATPTPPSRIDPSTDPSTKPPGEVGR